MVSKEELVRFLDSRVLTPAEQHPDADATIRKKVALTRMRLNQQVSAEKVEQYFWSAMGTDGGVDSYSRLSSIGTPTFEDVRAEFKNLCGRK